jgi:hypothetical protein
MQSTPVLAVLNVKSSYSQEVEEPLDSASDIPDTVQWWITAECDWRIKTFALDHDIHLYSIDKSGHDLVELAQANNLKHYGNVVDSQHVLEFRACTDLPETNTTRTRNVKPRREHFTSDCDQLLGFQVFPLMYPAEVRRSKCFSSYPARCSRGTLLEHARARKVVTPRSKVFSHHFRPPGYQPARARVCPLLRPVRNTLRKQSRTTFPRVPRRPPYRCKRHRLRASSLGGSSAHPAHERQSVKLGPLQVLGMVSCPSCTTSGISPGSS